MPRGPSQQIKKLDEERTKLLESAKADALARAEEAINELIALGFDYELAEPVRETTQNENCTQGVGTRSPSERDVPDMRVRDEAPHDKRSHKSQQKKRPFTSDELDQRSLVRAYL